MRPLPAIKVELRPMTLEDVEQVREIDVLSFPTPWPANSYRFEIVENPASSCWVAEMISPGEERKIIGMIVMWLILDEAHIATIAVHPEYRGNRIGRHLLWVALQDAVRRGADEATLEVRRSNLVAQNLYRSFGFEVVGSRPHYYQDNDEDALLMTVHGIDETYLKRLVERQGSGDAGYP